MRAVKMENNITWRDVCRQIIKRTLAQSAGKSETEIRKALKEAYPFENIKFTMYLVWLNEIHLQRKSKRPTKQPTENKNQGELF